MTLDTPSPQTRSPRARLLVLAATLLLAAPLTTGVEVDPGPDPSPSLPAALAQERRSSPGGPLPIPVNVNEGETFDAPACQWSRTDPDGTVRTRSSVRVGINEHGSLGVGVTGGINPGAYGTGFQMPIGTPHENLAVEWWGEGWLVYSAATGIAYHYPSDGVGGDVAPVDTFYVDSDRYVTHRVTVDLGSGGELLADFEWTLDRRECDLTLRTTIENQGDTTQDVAYKRVVDWDNLDFASALGLTPGLVGASWTEDGRTATATRYHGVGEPVPLYECRTTVLGTELPDTIDLDAWDDRYTVGVGTSHVTGSYLGDGNAGFHFSRDDLPPGGTWTTFLRYECDHFVQTGAPLEDVDALLRDATGA